MTVAIIKNKRSQVLFRLRTPRRDLQVICNLKAVITPKTDLRATVVAVSPFKARIEVCVP